ncbi:uncharacterized protein V6R79_009643 [Siganus canaliculatus]
MKRSSVAVWSQVLAEAACGRAGKQSPDTADFVAYGASDMATHPILFHGLEGLVAGAHSTEMDMHKITDNELQMASSSRHSEDATRCYQWTLKEWESFLSQIKRLKHVVDIEFFQLQLKECDIEDVIKTVKDVTQAEQERQKQAIKQENARLREEDKDNLSKSGQHPSREDTELHGATSSSEQLQQHLRTNNRVLFNKVTEISMPMCQRNHFQVEVSSVAVNFKIVWLINTVTGLRENNTDVNAPQQKCREFQLPSW